jgi:NO-binding membrane sensor protein with MHYT domain
VCGAWSPGYPGLQTAMAAFVNPHVNIIVATSLRTGYDFICYIAHQRHLLAIQVCEACFPTFGALSACAQCHEAHGKGRRRWQPMGELHEDTGIWVKMAVEDGSRTLV